jgi:hypothetical protein
VTAQSRGAGVCGAFLDGQHALSGLVRTMDKDLRVGVGVGGCSEGCCTGRSGLR